MLTDKHKIILRIMQNGYRINAVATHASYIPNGKLTMNSYTYVYEGIM